MPKTSTQRHVRVAVHSYGVLLCAGALMSFVPGANWGTVAFLVAYLGLLLPGNGLWFGATPVLRRRSIAILTFVALCAASLTWLVANGGQIGHWGRSIIPFLFLLSWFHLPSLTQREAYALARWILVAAAVWGGRILLEAIWLAAGDSDVLSVRLTTRVTDSVLPYPLVALPLLLFCPRLVGPIMRRIGIVTLLGLYIWIGYRGGLVIVALTLLIWLLTRRHVGYTLVAIGLCGPMLTLAVVGHISSSGFIADLLERYSTLESETEGVRALEWLYAIDQWMTAPLLGRGLGWQVPAEVAFFGVDELPFEMPESVGYVHSFIAYFLMNLGILGVLSYLACVWPSLPSWRGLVTGNITAAASMAVLMLLTFFLTQASFRQIQTIMVLMALIKLLYIPVRRPDHHQFDTQSSS
jgi:hypothetical protein